MNNIYLEYIDNGAFSNIYKTTTNQTSIKLDITQSAIKNDIIKNGIDLSNPICIKLSCLEHGSKEYEYLKQLENHKNIIKTYFGYYDSLLNLHVIGMPLYIGTAHEYRSKLNFKSLVSQLVDGIKYMHSMNIVHCDIKPKNILIKKENNNYIFSLIDFNTANIYKQGTMHRRFKLNYEKRIIGTINFCSLFCLLYCLPYPRDDMESLFLTCLFLNQSLDDDIFTNEQSLTTLRKFRLFIHQYKTIQLIRSYSFCSPIDYSLFEESIILDLNKFNK